MISLKITENEAGQRLDKLLMKYLDQAPKSLIYKLLRKKAIKRNDARAAGNELLKAGDEIKLFLAEDTLLSLRSNLEEKKDRQDKTAKQNKKDKQDRKGKKGGRDESGQTARLSDYGTILFENEHLILVNKRAGVLSQKSRDSDISINEVLRGYTFGQRKDSAKNAQDTFYVPSVCNRLDRNTSGLLLFAKTYAASRAAAELLKSRELHKTYLTIVKGDMMTDTSRRYFTAFLKKDARTNRVSIFEEEREGASKIETAYRPLRRVVCPGAEMLTLLEVELITGKTHQIRAHLSFLGHPIAGDAKYGDRMLNGKLAGAYGVKAQLLHAEKLQFPKELPPVFAELSGKCFTAKPPALWERILSES